MKEPGIDNTNKLLKTGVDLIEWKVIIKRKLENKNKTRKVASLSIFWELL